MRRVIIELFACLIVISCAAGVIYAQTSASVSVSFTIPVMPGLNAPLMEREEAKAEPQKQAEENGVAAQEENVTPEPQLIQQDSEGEKVLVKTFYSR
jgi:hypothetical protein